MCGQSLSKKSGATLPDITSKKLDTRQKKEALFNTGQKDGKKKRQRTLEPQKKYNPGNPGGRLTLSQRSRGVSAGEGG